MPGVPTRELRQLRALAAEVEACRETLHATVSSYAEDVASAWRRRRIRRRRVLTALGLVVLFGAGMTVAWTPSVDASNSQCAPGDATVTGVSLSIVASTVTAHFSIAPGCSSVSVSLVSYEAPAATFALPQTRFDSASGTFGTGGHELSARLPNCFFQADLVTGDVLQELSTGTLYGNRKAAFTQGGTTSCPPGPPPTTTTSTTGPTTSTTTTATTATGTTATGTTATGTTATGTTATGTTATGTTAVPATTTPVTTSPGSTGTTTPSGPFQPPQPVDIAVTKRADRASASVGEQVTYTLIVTNDGSGPAAAVGLVDPMPSQETFVSVNDPACSGGAVVDCALGTLGPGISRSITVVALARSPGTATNVATVSTTSPETNTANNQAHATVVIRGPFRPPAICAKLSLQKRTLLSGQRTTIVATVRRAGRRLRGARVEVRGAGILERARTDARGEAQFRLAPRQAGVLRIRVVQASSCPGGPAYLRVRGTFRPPQFTG